MANAPRAKGTKGEVEVQRLLGIDGLVRNPASSVVDLSRPGVGPAIQVLATRPDHGSWLVTMDLPTFKRLMVQMDEHGKFFDGVPPLDVEVKRYARFAHHGIFDSKFGRGRK